MISVRRAVEAELEEIHALDRLLLPESPPSDDTEFVGAWDGPHLVGYGGVRTAIRPWPGIAFMSRSGVVEGYRGQGLQKRMIRMRVRMAKRAGCCAVITYTTCDNAPSANSLISCGFKIYAPTTAYVGQGFIYWRLRL